MNNAVRIRLGIPTIPAYRFAFDSHPERGDIPSCPPRGRVNVGHLPRRFGFLAAREEDHHSSKPYITAHSHDNRLYWTEPPRDRPRSERRRPRSPGMDLSMGVWTVRHRSSRHVRAARGQLLPRYSKLALAEPNSIQIGRSERAEMAGFVRFGPEITTRG
jgi:hypothetical protein